MSYELTARAIATEVGNPLRKLVLIKLADNANKAGECWPSYKYLAEACEMANSSVRLHVKELERAGFIKVERRKGPKGNNSNLYLLTLPPMPTDSTPTPADGEPYADRRHTLCRQIAPESVIESVIEPINESKAHCAKSKVIPVPGRMIPGVYQKSNREQVRTALRNVEATDW